MAPMFRIIFPDGHSFTSADISIAADNYNAAVQEAGLGCAVDLQHTVEDGVTIDIYTITKAS